jgi:hypothetical protein
VEGQFQALATSPTEKDPPPSKDKRMGRTQSWTECSSKEKIFLDITVFWDMKLCTKLHGLTSQKMVIFIHHHENLKSHK